MRFFIYLVTMVLVAYHLQVRRFPSLRRIIGYFMIVGAISAFWAGFHLAMTEDALGRYGHVVMGMLGERISTTGEENPRTFGQTTRPLIVTSEGTAFYDVLGRLVATGSPAAWAVDYTYPCGRPLPCSGHAFVSHQRWLRMRTGNVVTVRYVTGIIGGSRLDDESQWATSIARMAFGIALLAAAVLIWGAPRRANLSEGTASRSSAQPAYRAGTDSPRRYTA